jgi:xanthine dehydrogenase accessory factor
MESFYQKAADTERAGKPAAVCIVISTSGSAPRKSGAKMIVYADGTIFGTIGGGAVEKQVITDAISCLAKHESMTRDYSLEADLSMHCGGKMNIFIEPLTLSPDLFIFGAGHVGKAVARYASDLGFRITLFDERPGIFEQGHIPGCSFVSGDFKKSVSETVFNDHCFIVIVTPEHIKDEEVLALVSSRPHAYIGMIGSKRKVEIIRQNLLAKKAMTEEQINQIDMPIGIKIAAETPEEIAISIIGKLIDVKNKNRL